MKKSVIISGLQYFFIFCFFNLQMNSVAWSMDDDKGLAPDGRPSRSISLQGQGAQKEFNPAGQEMTTRPSSIINRGSTTSSIPGNDPELGRESHTGSDDKRSSAFDDVDLWENDSCGFFLYMSEQINQGLAAQSSGKNLQVSPEKEGMKNSELLSKEVTNHNFITALDLVPDQAPDEKSRSLSEIRVTRAAALFSAVITALTWYFLFKNHPAMQDLISSRETASSPSVTTAAAFAALLIIPDPYLTLIKAFRASSALPLEEQSTLKNLGFYLFLIPALTVFVGPLLIAYVQALNNTHDESLKAVAGIGIIPFGGTLLVSAFPIYKDIWYSLYYELREYLPKKLRGSSIGNSTKDYLRRLLATALRKDLENESPKAYEISSTAYTKYFSVISSYQELLLSLEEKYLEITNPTKYEEASLTYVNEEASLTYVKAKATLLHHSRARTLAIIVGIFLYGEDGPNPSASRPLLPVIAKIIGGCAGALSTRALWYLIADVLDNFFRASPSLSSGAATTLTIPFGAYMIFKLAQWSEDAACHFIHHSLIKTTPFINDKTTVNFSNLNIAVFFLNTIRTGYLMLVLGAMANIAMENGITSVAPALSTQTRLWTLIPYIFSLAALTQDYSKQSTQLLAQKLFLKKSYNAIRRWGAMAALYNRLNVTLRDAPADFAIMLKYHLENAKQQVASRDSSGSTGPGSFSPSINLSLPLNPLLGERARND